jgi:DNA-binding response OmpR family regulator
VSTGAEALEAIERNRYDLVLLDVQLPDINGLEIARRIRERASQHWQIYIVALTADTQPSTRAACLSAGVDTYLTKPLQMAELHTVLASYHNGTSAAPPGTNIHTGEASPPATSVSAERPLDRQVLERLHSLFGQHRARLHALIEHYCDDTATLSATMYRAFAENDIDTLRLSAHQLKSSSAIVAALPLAHLCAQFEAAIDTNNPDDWHAWIQQIEAEILRVQTALKAEILS